MTTSALWTPPSTCIDPETLVSHDRLKRIETRLSRIEALLKTLVALMREEPGTGMEYPDPSLGQQSHA